MANTLVRLPDITVYPGTPATPATPGYCSTTIVGYRTVVTGEGGGGLPPGQVVESDNPLDSPQYMFRPDTLDNVGGVSHSLIRTPAARREPIYSTTCVEGTPGTPGIPTTVDRNFGPDWRSSARSLSYVRQGAAFTFTSTSVVIAGLIDRPAGPGIPLELIRYGVLVAPDGNLYRVMAGAVDGTPLGVAADYTRLRVSSVRGRSSIEGDVGGWVTLSSDSVMVQPESIFAASLLNREESTVADPELTQLNVALEAVSGQLGLTSAVTPSVLRFAAPQSSLPLSASLLAKINDAWLFSVTGRLPMSSVVRESVRLAFPDSGGVTTKLPLTGSVTGVAKPDSVLRIPKQQFFAGNSLGGSVSMVVPRQEFTITSGTGGPQYSSIRGSLFASAPHAVGVGTTGGIGGSQLSLAPLQFVAADYGYTSATLRVAPMQAEGYGYAGTRGYVANLDFLVAVDEFSVTGATLVTFDSEFELTGDASILVVADAEILGALELTGDASFQSVIMAAISDGLRLSSTGSIPSDDLQQYVYNLASAAVSRFDGFAFDGVVGHMGEAYGYTSEGVYRVTDAPEEPISAAADFGAMSFANNNATHIETVFLGLSADGHVYLKLDSGGKERTYRVVDREPTMRVHTGRGLTAREWRVKLEFVDTTRVELSNVEFVVAASTRRWTR